MKFRLLILCALLCTGPAAADDEWEFNASASTYFLQDETYVSPVISADRKQFHVEARYNDEALDTTSIFLGYNFHSGENLTISATPMFGGIFGDINGVAPGLSLELAYHKFSLLTEPEYFFSTDEKESNFFYMWSELAYSPKDWFWFGIAGQRTRAYQTDLDVQRGFLLGFGKGNFSVTGYIMNLGWGDSFGLVSAEYQF